MKCIICLDNIQILFQNKCSHSFCKECIIQWYFIKPKCPLCNYELFIEDDNVDIMINRKNYFICSIS